MNPLPFLPFINARRTDPLQPTSTIGCAVCPTTFQVKDGAAFEARCGNEPVIGLFCSTLCFIKAVPADCCARA